MLLTPHSTRKERDPGNGNGAKNGTWSLVTDSLLPSTGGASQDPQVPRGLAASLSHTPPFPTVLGSEGQGPG